jgi:hypothetical protein
VVGIYTPELVAETGPLVDETVMLDPETARRGQGTNINVLFMYSNIYILYKVDNDRMQGCFRLYDDTSIHVQ